MSCGKSECGVHHVRCGWFNCTCLKDWLLTLCIVALTVCGCRVMWCGLEINWHETINENRENHYYYEHSCPCGAAPVCPDCKVPMEKCCDKCLKPEGECTCEKKVDFEIKIDGVVIEFPPEEHGQVAPLYPDDEPTPEERGLAEPKKISPNEKPKKPAPKKPVPDCPKP